MIMSCRKIKEQEISNLKKIRSKINRLLKIAIIQIGYFPENEIYLRQKEKLATELDIEFLAYNYDKNTKQEDIIRQIEILNADTSITGIMLQKPILEGFDDTIIINTISPLKDVDGLNKINRQKRQTKEEGIIPCTALAVLKILDEYNIKIVNQKIAIIGKSDLVGKPLFDILSTNNQVTLCDSKTINIKENILKNNIIITAIGKPKYITEDMVSKDNIIIDVGTNLLNNKLVGDVDFDNVEPKVKMITPVPGGVGQLTPLYLFYNLIKAHQLQNK